MKKEQKEKMVAFRLSLSDFELLSKLSDNNKSALLRRLLRYYHEDTIYDSAKKEKDRDKT